MKEDEKLPKIYFAGPDSTMGSPAITRYHHLLVRALALSALTVDGYILYISFYGFKSNDIDVRMYDTISLSFKIMASAFHISAVKANCSQLSMGNEKDMDFSKVTGNVVTTDALSRGVFGTIFLLRLYNSSIMHTHCRSCRFMAITSGLLGFIVTNTHAPTFHNSGQYSQSMGGVFSTLGTWFSDLGKLLVHAAQAVFKAFKGICAHLPIYNELSVTVIIKIGLQVLRSHDSTVARWLLFGLDVSSMTASVFSTLMRLQWAGLSEDPEMDVSSMVQKLVLRLVIYTIKFYSAPDEPYLLLHAFTHLVALLLTAVAYIWRVVNKSKLTEREKPPAEVKWTFHLSATVMITMGLMAFSLPDGPFTRPFQYLFCGILVPLSAAMIYFREYKLPAGNDEEIKLDQVVEIQGAVEDWFSKLEQKLDVRLELEGANQLIWLLDLVVNIPLHIISEVIFQIVLKTLLRIIGRFVTHVIIHSCVKAWGYVLRSKLPLLFVAAQIVYWIEVQDAGIVSQCLQTVPFAVAALARLLQTGPIDHVLETQNDQINRAEAQNDGTDAMATGALTSGVDTGNTGTRALSATGGAMTTGSRRTPSVSSVTSRATGSRSLPATGAVAAGGAIRFSAPLNSNADGENNSSEALPASSEIPGHGADDQENESTSWLDHVLFIERSLTGDGHDTGTADLASGVDFETINDEFQLGLGGEAAETNFMNEFFPRQAYGDTGSGTAGLYNQRSVATTNADADFDAAANYLTGTSATDTSRADVQGLTTSSGNRTGDTEAKGRHTFRRGYEKIKAKFSKVKSVCRD